MAVEQGMIVQNLNDEGSFSSQSMCGQPDAAHPMIPSPRRPVLRTGEPPSGTGPWLWFDLEKYTYVLNDQAKAALQPMFSNWGYDVNQVQLLFGFTNGNAAVTVGKNIMISAESWERLHTAGPQEQLALLAHEITHCVQYRDMGVPRFWARYGPEYQRPDNYDPPPALIDKVAKEGANNLNVTDARWTLDQIATVVELQY
jgi:hypothetical protein